MNNPYRILSVDDPVDAKLLARKARRVTNVHSTEVILGIQRMKRAATAWEHENGRRCEGLAATQIGWNRRVIILRRTNEQEPKDPRTLTQAEFDAAYEHCKTAAPKYADASPEVVYADMVDGYLEWCRKYGSTFDPWLVLINPVVKQSEGEQTSVEGCLSVPHGGYTVTRPTHMAFKYTRPNRTFSGIHLAKGDNAIKLDHELKHLEGTTINQNGFPLIGTDKEIL